MQKSELEQIRDLRKEIKDLDEKVEKMQRERVGRVQDKVHASMKDFPYVYTTKNIKGVDEKDKKSRRALTDSEILLLRRRQQAIDAEYRITKYINGINDSRIRRIISLRYEEGMSWKEVADELGYDRTYPEKLLSKYLQEHPEESRKVPKKTE